MVYKFPELSHEEVAAMFSVSELKQTRVYRNARDEGGVDEAWALVLRLLSYRFGAVDSATEAKIRALSLCQMEDLGEALLDFSIWRTGCRR